MVLCEFPQIPQSLFDSFQLQNLGINFKDTIYTNLLPQKPKKKIHSHEWKPEQHFRPYSGGGGVREQKKTKKHSTSKCITVI